MSSRSSVPEVLAQHRDRGDEEHADERKDPEQRHADPLEHLGPVGEELVDEEDEHDRHRQDEGDRPRVAAQLSEHAHGRRPRCPGAQLPAPCSIS